MVTTLPAIVSQQTDFSFWLQELMRVPARSRTRGISVAQAVFGILPDQTSGGPKMKRRPLAGFLAAMLLTFFSVTIQAAPVGAEEDTDTRLVEARVVEVAEARVSVMARTGVEHVISVDRNGTKVTIDGEVVSLKDIREGDIVTIELDAQNPVKFAKNILMRSSESQVARVRR
jgi:hypothetical protein